MEYKVKLMIGKEAREIRFNAKDKNALLKQVQRCGVEKQEIVEVFQIITKVRRIKL